MKQLAAIAFSLLVIAAQTFAVAAPMAGGVSVAKRSCCGEDCCCVSSDAPVTPATPATVPIVSQNQFILMPTAGVLFTLAPAPGQLSPSSSFAEFRTATVPIFQRNCSFLI